MKIAFTGDNTSGQFYPIIAIAERVFEQAEARHLVPPQLYYLATAEYSQVHLFNNQIKFVKMPGSEKSPHNSTVGFIQYLKSSISIVRALMKLFVVYPDVILSKGGASTFPTLAAAKLLGIPVLIHETDTVPSPSNLWAAKFAKRIGVAYKASAQYFPAEKTAYVGQPIRKEIEYPLTEGAREYLHLESSVPVLLVLGSTDDSTFINDTIVNALPLLVDRYQIIHQTGKSQIQSIRDISKVILQGSEYADRYHPFSFLDDLAIRMAAGSATLAISQAGSVMFELAAWKIPAIVIPVTKSKDDHQRKNAFAYARIGGAEVIEEVNLTPHLLANEIDRLVQNPAIRQEMQQGASEFHQADAAKKIADGLLDIALTHED
jgi:UDP-N-acetylglucosamine--N-acetylmuramyl-(pentapeptide) pyrophosphoryl-undecaprenol N-acetylglucosamine transferase